MGILFALFGSLLNAGSDVFYKQAVNLNKKGTYFHIFIGNLDLLIISCAIVLFGWVESPILFVQENILLLLGVLAYSSLYVIYDPLTQQAYKSEKISSLQPFSHLGSIFGIFMGFFFFGEKQVGTFFIALLAFMVVSAHLYTQTKKIRISSGLLYYLVSRVFVGCEWIILGLILATNPITDKKLSALELYTYDGLLVFIVTCIFLLAKKKTLNPVKNPKRYYPFSIFSSLLANTGHLISLFIIVQLGIVVGIMLGLTGMVTTLVFSFLYFKDTPSRKDVLVALTVLVLISIGFSL